ncbi:MAG: hypothetical protein ACE5Q6_21040 [Dehalococcoidia bacterium]
MSITVVPERTLLRIGAISAVLGALISVGGNAIHGGDDPANLLVSLSQYAANANWVVAHILQFLGFLLIVGGLVALYRSIPAEPGAALARLGFVAALVSVGVYAANQGVDGIAIKFVAEEWVNAPAEEKEVAFRVAEAVRYVEIGLSSFSALILGMSLVLYGLAIALSDVYPKWSGWVAVPIGLAWGASGVVIAYLGFSQHILIGWVSIAVALWVLVIGVLMWRRASATV